MITDKELERIDGFWLDPKLKYYHDNEDWAFIPLNKNRKEWDFCAMSCIDGETEPLFRITKDMTMEQLKEMFYLVTNEELFINNEYTRRN